MTSEQSCKFYEDSICVLKGGYCDLNCDQTTSNKEIQSYDEIDTLIQWRIEKAKKESASLA